MEKEIQTTPPAETVIESITMKPIEAIQTGQRVALQGSVKSLSQNCIQLLPNLDPSCTDSENLQKIIAKLKRCICLNSDESPYNVASFLCYTLGLLDDFYKNNGGTFIPTIEMQEFIFHVIDINLAVIANSQISEHRPEYGTMATLHGIVSHSAPASAYLQRRLLELETSIPQMSDDGVMELIFSRDLDKNLFRLLWKTRVLKFKSSSIIDALRNQALDEDLFLITWNTLLNTSDLQRLYMIVKDKEEDKFILDHYCPVNFLSSWLISSIQDNN